MSDDFSLIDRDRLLSVFIETPFSLPVVRNTCAPKADSDPEEAVSDNWGEIYVNDRRIQKLASRRNKAAIKK